MEKSLEVIIHDSFQVGLIIFVVITALTVKGAGAENLKPRLFSGNHTENSQSFYHVVNSPNQLAEMNSLTALNTENIGHGGSEDDIELTVLQENSILAYLPPAKDYIDELSTTRHQIAEYTVQPGDRLSFIASDFGVSVESIVWANSLTNGDNLRLDQVLRIPPVSGVIHKVKRADTVPSLAKKYGVTEDEIIVFNDLPQDGQLRADDELIIPGGRPAGAPKGTPASNQATIVKRFAYLPDLGDFFLLPAAGFNWGKIHGRNGVDVANSCGTAIYAAANGTVVTAITGGWNGGFGSFVKLGHDNGTETLYAHAKKLLVSVGESVSRGQLVALMGTTGRSTGCHLHFEVHGARNPLAKY